MIPLEVRCHLGGPVMFPRGPVALDALLAWAVAQRMGMGHLLPEEQPPIEIPVQREPQGRFHLASLFVGTIEAREGRWINRRFPIEEAQAMGATKLKKIDLSSGPTKSFRIPTGAAWLVGDQLVAWCVGDREEVTDLLGDVRYIGAKRSVGLGKIQRWEVGPADPWDGFPVMLEGMPLRPLPRDWAGVSDDAPMALRVPTYPYYETSREEPMRVAEWML